MDSTTQLVLDIVSTVVQLATSLVTSVAERVKADQALSDEQKQLALDQLSLELHAMADKVEAVKAK